MPLKLLLPEFLQLQEVVKLCQVSKNFCVVSTQYICKRYVKEHVIGWNALFEHFSVIPFELVDAIFLNFAKKTYIVHLLDMCSFHNRFDWIIKICEIYHPPKEWFHCALANSCLKGNFLIVVYLHETYGVMLNDDCWIALDYGMLNIVKYLYSKNIPINGNSIAQACCYDQKETLQWIWNNHQEDLLLHRNEVSRGIDFCASESNKELINILHSWGFSGIQPLYMAKTYNQSPLFINWLKFCGYKQ